MIFKYYVADGGTVVSWSCWPSERVSKLRFVVSISFDVPSRLFFSFVLTSSSSSSGKNFICSRGANVSESGGYGHWLARRVEGFLTHARPWNTRTLSRNSFGIFGVGLETKQLKWKRNIFAFFYLAIGFVHCLGISDRSLSGVIGIGTLDKDAIGSLRSPTFGSVG